MSNVLDWMSLRECNLKKFWKAKWTWCVVWFQKSLVKDNHVATVQTKLQNKFWEFWVRSAWCLFQKALCWPCVFKLKIALFWWCRWLQLWPIRNGCTLQSSCCAASQGQVECQRPWAWSPIRWVTTISWIFFLQWSWWVSLRVYFQWFVVWWMMGMTPFLSAVMKTMMKQRVEHSIDIRACQNALILTYGNVCTTMRWAAVSLVERWILHQFLQRQHQGLWDVRALCCVICLFQMPLESFMIWWFVIMNKKAVVMQWFTFSWCCVALMKMVSRRSQFDFFIRWCSALCRWKLKPMPGA